MNMNTNYLKQAQRSIEYERLMDNLILEIVKNHPTWKIFRIHDSFSIDVPTNEAKRAIDEVQSRLNELENAWKNKK